MKNALIALFAVAAGIPVALAGRANYWEPNYDESKVAPYTLEDPLTFADGRRLKSAAEWPARRREIISIFAREMYGAEPPPPECLVVEKFDEAVTLAGFGIRRQYRMWFRKDRTGPSVDWLVLLPRYAKKPVPPILFLNYAGNHELIRDPEVTVTKSWLPFRKGFRADPAARGKYENMNTVEFVFPAHMILARGFGIVTACYCDVSPDVDRSADRPFSRAYEGVFSLWPPRDESRDDNTTAIGAWAWALSRGLDMVARDIPELDAARSVATGYSRLGKTALLAAARDERFAVCVPNQTGGGGCPLAKRDFGENVATEVKMFPYWYCRAYAKYASDPAKLLTFDQHLLLASIAPRALMVQGYDAPWFDTRGEYLACRAASPAWTFLGQPGLPDRAFPDDYDTSCIGPRLAYVRRTEGHGHSAHDWTWLMDFAEAALASSAAAPRAAARPADASDLVIYGATPAGLAAAVQARRMGFDAVLVEPSDRIGGLTTGGLGSTDIGSKSAYGGIALDFYKDVRRWYSDPAHWKNQPPPKFAKGPVAPDADVPAMWTFEPSAALAILEGWVRREGLKVVRGERLDRGVGGVTLKDGRIAAMRTESGRVFRADCFIDATYEGDLMAAAGVSYTWGREANAKYGERYNGIQTANADYHQFFTGVDPYVVKGDTKSGLLPGVEPFAPGEKDGDGDRRVQAYCFRMCLTDVPENRIPFAKPEGYDEREFELLFRDFEQRAAHPEEVKGYLVGICWINSQMPCRKTDTNNRHAFSTDFIGGNWNWPEASYAERDRIFARHLHRQKCLMWTLANHPRVPEYVRKEVSRWGTCKDEFLDRSSPGGGWQGQLYVREARRMVGEYVMTEHDCARRRAAPKPVAKGSYNFDSHHVRRRVGPDGFVHNEGDVEIGTGKGPYGIAYGAIVPKRGECANLIVPVCLSASHIAYGSIRMEPVFFALGQAAGTAAAIAVRDRVAVQDVDYGKLSARLESDGQVFR